MRILELRDALFCTIFEEINVFPEISSDIHEEIKSALEICMDIFDEHSDSENA